MLEKYGNPTADFLDSELARISEKFNLFYCYYYNRYDKISRRAN